MRPFVWAECAQHIHVNLRPGCFQIRRANPKRVTWWVCRLSETSLRHSVSTICVDRGQPFGCSHALLFGPSVLSINIFNVLPGCFQISRANPKRPQLLKRGFVLETHRSAPFVRVTCAAKNTILAHDGGFRLSRASPAPVSLEGGFRLSRASPAPVSLGGGFRL